MDYLILRFSEVFENHLWWNRPRLWAFRFQSSRSHWRPRYQSWLDNGATTQNNKLEVKLATHEQILRSTRFHELAQFILALTQLFRESRFCWHAQNHIAPSLFLGIERLTIFQSHFFKPLYFVFSAFALCLCLCLCFHFGSRHSSKSLLGKCCLSIAFASSLIRQSRHCDSWQILNSLFDPNLPLPWPYKPQTTNKKLFDLINWWYHEFSYFLILSHVVSWSLMPSHELSWSLMNYHKISWIIILSHMADILKLWLAECDRSTYSVPWSHSSGH